MLSVGLSANAQSTGLTLSFTGTGINSTLGFFLNGHGTITPLGTATLSITGVPTGSTTSLAFAFLFADGSTMAAAASATPGPGTLTGTATITGGTVAYAGATGSFTFSIAAPFDTSQTLPFTFTGSGALGQGAICADLLDTGGAAFPPAGGTGTVNITTAVGCPWSVAGPPNWITNATSGTGSGTLSYQVTPNAGVDRSVTTTIGGVPYEIEHEFE